MFAAAILWEDRGRTAWAVIKECLSNISAGVISVIRHCKVRQATHTRFFPVRLCVCVCVNKWLLPSIFMSLMSLVCLNVCHDVNLVITCVCVADVCVRLWHNFYVNVDPSYQASCPEGFSLWQRADRGHLPLAESSVHGGRSGPSVLTLWHSMLERHILQGDREQRLIPADNRQHTVNKK